ncbi:hypothetical protein AMECASPLE_017739 [Ameca splendens]|uniref:Uncharacterized protein n=1 Tax=Ameca splendens TaxID=208324 RepID=A0ABV0ZYA2_9TELE
MKPIHCRSGCMFWIVGQLEAEPLPQFQALFLASSRFSSGIAPVDRKHIFLSPLTGIPVPAYRRNPHSMMLPPWHVQSIDCRRHLKLVGPIIPHHPTHTLTHKTPPFP